MKRDSSEEYLGKYEVVFGQHLDANDPQLSPKVKQLVQDKLDIEHILDASPDDSPKGAQSPTAAEAPVNTVDSMPKDHSLATVKVPEQAPEAAPPQV